MVKVHRPPGCAGLEQHSGTDCEVTPDGVDPLAAETTVGSAKPAWPDACSGGSALNTLLMVA